MKCRGIMQNSNQLFLDNIKLLDRCTSFINICRIQRYIEVEEEFLLLFSDIDKLIQSFLENYKTLNLEYNVADTQFLTTMINDIKKAYKYEDLVFLGDLFELQVVPFISDVQTKLKDDIDIYTSDELWNNNISLLKNEDPKLLAILMSYKQYDINKYVLEYTDIGAIALYIEEQQDRYYINTLQNPYEDGREMAKRYYEENISHYIVFGLGMGYHIIEMGKLYRTAIIDVYESDLSVIKIAFQYNDLTELLNNDRIHIHYDPDFIELSKYLEKMGKSKNRKERFIIHFPSIHNIQQPNIRNWMEELFYKDNHARNEAPRLSVNFSSNIREYDVSVDSLSATFYGKTLFIIAAGPSLDKNVQLLKKVPRGSCIILATGTVFKKLMKLDITPDYFIVSDPYNKVYKQIEGIEECDIPMILLSTALKDFATNYKGKKYIIFQKEFPLAEEYAEKMGYQLYNTGGSVSTIALDIGIHFRCKSIVYLGLDLAYTDNFAHASDTSRRDMNTLDNMPYVKSFEGGLVLSSNTFIGFKQWIERRICEVHDIEFIDATEGGAWIEGSKIMKLEEVINSFNSNT